MVTSIVLAESSFRRNITFNFFVYNESYRQKGYTVQWIMKRKGEMWDNVGRKSVGQIAVSLFLVFRRCNCNYAVSNPWIQLQCIINMEIVPKPICCKRNYLNMMSDKKDNDDILGY